MHRVLLPFLLLSLFTRLGPAKTVVTGRVTGLDDKPLIRADVFLRQPFDTATIKAVEVDREGNFRITIPSNGIWLLVADGVGHAEHIVALYVDKPEDIKVDIALGANTYLRSLDDVKAFGSFNNWYNLTAVPLEKQPDGMFVAEIKTEKPFISYQLMNAKYGGSVEGTQADRYVFNQSHGYESLIKAENGIAKIVFDPRVLFRSERQAEVSFTNASRLLSRFNEIYAQRVQFEDSFQVAFRAHLNSRDRNPETFEFDFSKYVSSIRSQLDTEKEPVLRDELYLNYLAINIMERRIEPTFYSTVLTEVPAASMTWSLEPHSIFFALDHSNLKDAEKENYVREVVSRNPTRRVISALLFDEFMASKMMGDNQKAGHYYEILVRNFGDTPEGKHISKFFSNPAALTVGSPVPKFSVVSLDNMTSMISNKSLLGKYCLIFIWASKDPNSLVQIQYLQKAFERYDNSRLEILAISVDSSYEDVVNFRKGKWKMPWLNAYLGRDRNNEVIKAFNAYDIPKAYLVSPKGRIAAVGASLLGSELEMTLKRFLGE